MQHQHVATPHYLFELVAVGIGVYLAMWAQRKASERHDRNIEAEQRKLQQALDESEDRGSDPF